MMWDANIWVMSSSMAIFLILLGSKAEKANVAGQVYYKSNNILIMYLAVQNSHLSTGYIYILIYHLVSEHYYIGYI